MNKADIILHGASIITMDDNYPDAHAVAVFNGRIIAVGGDDVIQSFRGRQTRLINCHDGTLMPGFQDAHCHPVGLAENALILNIDPVHVQSISGILDQIRISAQSIPAGQWIRAGRYNEFYLDEKRHPTRSDLDKATYVHPVKLSHRSGHVHVLNSLALELAGITIETPDPPGGLIDRDSETGEPNGILYNMGHWLASIIPQVSEEEMDKGMRKASETLLSAGITAVADASERNDIDRWNAYRRWKKVRAFEPRVTMMAGMKALEDGYPESFCPASENHHLAPGPVKIILGEVSGGIYPPPRELQEMVLAVHRAGLQVAIHAFEPAEIDAACHAIQYALEKHPASHHRHRIEHCSVCNEAMARKLASLGIVVATQPPFIYYSGDRYLETVEKDKLGHLYPLARLIRAGITVAGSSDAPVVPVDVFDGIYGAVTRRTKSGNTLLYGERINITDALRLYTVNAAFSMCADTWSGTITPGKYADMILLDENPAILPVERMRDIKVQMTMIGGEIVWERPGFRR